MSRPSRLSMLFGAVALLLLLPACPKPAYTLSVQVTGQGTVTQDPDAGSYARGTTVTLTATPGTGWQFTRWEGDLTGSANPAAITVTDDVAINAIFTEEIGEGEGEGEGEVPVLKLGAILPLTGSAEAIGTQEQNAMALALDDLNGADSGVRLEVVYEDCLSDDNEALPSFERLVAEVPDMLACLPSLSRISSVVAPEANTREIPVLTLATSMPGITAARPWAFRLHSTSAQEAAAMAQHWRDHTTVRRVAFFYINDAMGQGAFDTFQSTFTGDGAAVVWSGSYEQTDTDFSAKIAAALDANPDGVYLMGFIATTVELILQVHDALAGNPLPLASNLGMATPEFIAQGGDAYEGMYFTTLPFMFDKDTPETRAYAFAGKYREAYAAEPDIYAGLAYDTLGMIAQATGGNVVTRDEFRVHFGAVTGYQGVMGELSMDTNREIVLPVGVAQLEDGILEPVS